MHSCSHPDLPFQPIESSPKKSTPRRHRPLSQADSHKKLTSPFRSPLIATVSNTTSSQPKPPLPSTPRSTANSGHFAKPKSKPASNSRPTSDASSSSLSLSKPFKSPFKSPLSQDSPSAPSPNISIPALERQLQLLKQAHKIKTNRYASPSISFQGFCAPIYLKFTT